MNVIELMHISYSFLLHNTAVLGVRLSFISNHFYHSLFKATLVSKP